MSTSVLSQYKRTNDKIKALKDKGVIKSVKRGIYIPRENANMRQSESGLIADPHGNHLGTTYQRIQQQLSYGGWRVLVFIYAQ